MTELIVFAIGMVVGVVIARPSTRKSIADCIRRVWNDVRNDDDGKPEGS